LEREGEKKLDMLNYMEGTVHSQKKVAEVFQYGVEKHGKNDWKKRESRLFLEAHCRHLHEILAGRIFDGESTLQHVYHAIADLLMYAEQSHQEFVNVFGMDKESDPNA